VVRPRGLRVEEREIKPYDFNDVLDTCEAVIKENDGAQLTLNVTGGTKISALAAFQAFFFENRRIIYLDSANRRIIELSDSQGHEAAEINKNLVTVRDYLACYGLIMENDGSLRPATRIGEIVSTNWLTCSSMMKNCLGHSIAL